MARETRQIERTMELNKILISLLTSLMIIGCGKDDSKDETPPEPDLDLYECNPPELFHSYQNRTIPTNSEEFIPIGMVWLCDGADALVYDNLRLLQIIEGCEGVTFKDWEKIDSFIAAKPENATPGICRFTVQSKGQPLGVEYTIEVVDESSED